VINLFQRGKASMGRINEIFEEQPEIVDDPATVKGALEVQGEIEFGICLSLMTAAKSCTTSICAFRPDRAWRSWAQPVPEKTVAGEPDSPAFTMPRRERS